MLSAFALHCVLSGCAQRRALPICHSEKNVDDKIRLPEWESPTDRRDLQSDVRHDDLLDYVDFALNDFVKNLSVKDTIFIKFFTGVIH